MENTCHLGSRHKFGQQTSCAGSRAIDAIYPRLLLVRGHSILAAYMETACSSSHLKFVFMCPCRVRPLYAFLHGLIELDMLAWHACPWICFSRSCLDRVVCTIVASHLVCLTAIDLVIDFVVSITSSKMRTSSGPWS